MDKKLPLQEVLDLIPVLPLKSKVRIDISDKSINVSSRRMQTFKQKGIVCVHCGLTATHWELDVDKSGKDWKVKLMSDDVELTQDHVIPKSRGGTDVIENAQTLCNICNKTKGSRLESEL